MNPEKIQSEQSEQKEKMSQNEELFTLRAHLQAKLLHANHPDWEEDPEKLMSSDFERLAKEFSDYINEHPEVLEEFKHAPEDTIKKLKEKLYH